MIRYLVDTSVLVQANNTYYRFEFCPAFWDWLEERSKAGVLASVSRVCDEIRNYEVQDNLTNWANERDDGFFLPPNQNVIKCIDDLRDWASEQDYPSTAQSEFFSGADCWLVAHACTLGCSIVTHEVYSETQKRIKIPVVCAHFGIQCVTAFDMLQQENALFVLDRS